MAITIVCLRYFSQKLDQYEVQNLCKECVVSLVKLTI